MRDTHPTMENTANNTDVTIKGTIHKLASFASSFTKSTIRPATLNLLETNPINSSITFIKLPVFFNFRPSYEDGHLSCYLFRK